MACDASANDFVVNGSAVVARWRSRGSDNAYLGHGHPEASCQAALDIHFQHDERKAFVKLRVPVGIKAATRKIYVYFFIHPEHILSLDRFDCHESEDRSQATIPEQVQSALVRSKQCSSSESITGLKFSLSKPGALVVPVDTALAPKTKASGNILDALYSLGWATTVTLYVPTPRISDSRQLDLLCSSVSSRALKSIEDVCSLAMLYHGSGGRVIEHLDDPLTDTDPLANDDAAFYTKADSPPSYDEISLTPPPHRRAQRHRLSPQRQDEQPPSKKTKVRSQAASSRAHHTAKTGSLAQEWKRTVDDQLQALAADVKAMREEMRSTQAARRTSPAQGSAASTASQESSGNSLSERMDRTEKAIEALRAQVEQSEKRFEERLLEVAERVTAEAEQRVREGLEDDLQDVRDATSEQTDVKIEESFLNMKDEMREYIAEELKAVEDVLKDSIRGAVLSIDID